jgi:hypothetical protein
MYDNGMIAPVVALLAWSFLMLIWLYATRIPAMRAAKIKPNQASKGDLEKLPASVQNVAANYNHLMEQPTLFYAVCFALEILSEGEVHPVNIGLAWTYVALRVLHSLVQGTVNIIMLRWFIFMLSSVALGALIFHAAVATGMVAISLPH